MIRCLVALALVLPAMASAQPISAEKQNDCARKAEVFEIAAANRDGNISPQDTFSSFKRANYVGVTDDFLKRAINLVFFDPSFHNSRGQSLMLQMLQVCEHPDGRWKPLK
jgi:hypothetical protein